MIDELLIQVESLQCFTSFPIVRVFNHTFAAVFTFSRKLAEFSISASIRLIRISAKNVSNLSELKETRLKGVTDRQ